MGKTLLLGMIWGMGCFYTNLMRRLGGTTDILAYAGKNLNKGYTFEFAIPMDSGDDFDTKLESGKEYPVILAVHGSSTNFDAKHTHRGSTTIVLDE